jgi:hypothetical protein
MTGNYEGFKGEILSDLDSLIELAESNGKATQASEDAVVLSQKDDMIDQLNGDLASLQKEFDDYKESHPDTPPPPPPPTDGPTPLIGMSSPANVWDARAAAVQATGGRLQARRIFGNSLTDVPSTVGDAIRDGMAPVLSFKPGSYTWGQIASGAADADLRATGAKLKALGGLMFVTIHHEPSKQSLGPTKGEGGTAAEFAAMQSHACDVLKAAAPNIRYGVIANGWWWTAGKARFTDAQIEVWLPKALRQKLDFIAADDYSPDGGESGLVKTRNRVAWANRVGGVKATGIGETNAFVAKDLTDIFAYAKTEPMFAGGFACVWNSTGDSYLPLDQTGLLDDFQAILKNW